MNEWTEVFDDIVLSVDIVSISRILKSIIFIYLSSPSKKLLQLLNDFCNEMLPVSFFSYNRLKTIRMINELISLINRL